jgi:hypothetical protein
VKNPLEKEKRLWKYASPPPDGAIPRTGMDTFPHRINFISGGWSPHVVDINGTQS